MKQTILGLILAILIAPAVTAYADNNPEQPRNYQIKYPDQVNSLLMNVEPNNMWSNLGVLTAFPDRHMDSDTGRAAAMFIKDQLDQMIKQYGRTDAEVIVVPTIDDYSNVCANQLCNATLKQPSIMLKIGASSRPAVVFSAHMDTKDSRYSPPQFKPGAEDNASGTVVLMEAARTILSSKYQFKKPIYFIWDAGEENGEIGLKDIIYHYFQKGNLPIYAVLNYDETGFSYNNDPSIIVQKNLDGQREEPFFLVDSKLTDFLATLITQYLNVPVAYTNFYFGTDLSDWTSNGYKVAQASDGYDAYYNVFPFHTHNSDDTMNNLSLPRLTQFAKLAVAFGVELAELAY